MNSGLLFGTAGVVLATAAIESAAERGRPWPPAGVWAGVGVTTVLMAGLGAAAPQLADGLTWLILLTAVLRLPWDRITGAVQAAAAPTTPTPPNLR